MLTPSPSSGARRAPDRPGAAPGGSPLGPAAASAAVAAIVVVALLAPSAASAGGPRRLDLRVSVPAGATVVAGRTVVVRAIVRNAGRRRSGAGSVTALLSTDGRPDRRDRRLTSRPVRALAAGRSATVALRIVVPRTATGRSVLLCAERAGRVREPFGSNACRRLRVGVGTGPGADAVPAPSPAPSSPPDPGGSPTPASPPPGAAPTPAGSPAEGPFRIESLSAAFPAPTADERDAGVTAIEDRRQAFCAGRGASDVASVDAAVASARRVLTARAGATAMAAFDASPEHDDPRRAERAAAAAVLHGEPGAALAALLRIHELEPLRAAPLVDAAAVASSLGLASEALAMLDGARALQPDAAEPLGVSGAALADANRGQALTLLGRDAEADRALTAARSTAPVLKAAAQTQAATAVCRFGGRAGAEQAYDLVLEGEDPPLGRRATPVHEEGGTATRLRGLVLPQSPAEAVAKARFYEVAVPRSHDREIDARNAAQDAHLRGLGDSEQHWSPAQFHRYLGISDQINRVGDRAAVAARRRAMDDAYDRALDVHWDFWGEPGEARAQGRYQRFTASATSRCSAAPDYAECYGRELNALCRPALVSAHATWLQRMDEAQDAASAYVAALSTSMSALSSHLGNSDAHALAVLQIEAVEFAVATSRSGRAQGWSSAARLRSGECVERPADPPPAEAEIEDAPGVATPGACPRLAKPINARLDLGPVTLKVNCEEVELSGDIRLTPWIGAFGEVKYDPRAAAITVFVGAQAGGSTSIGPPGTGDVASASFKSGMYVRVGDDGIRDVGWRTGPGMNAGYGAAEIELKDEIDISFMGSVSSTFGG